MGDNVGERVLLKWRLPLAEVITDFFDHLQTTTHGYATFLYEPAGYEDVDLVKVDVKLNGDIVDALSFLALRDNAPKIARKYLAKLADLIPRQQFDIGLQGTVGKKVMAKERIK